MLPRRHIRIKVFQSLYSYSQQKAQNPIKEEFEKNLIAYTELYYLIIYLLLLLKKVAEEEAKWDNEFDEIDDYEPTDEELMETENPEFNNINLELEIE